MKTTLILFLTLLFAGCASPEQTDDSTQKAKATADQPSQTQTQKDQSSQDKMGSTATCRLEGDVRQIEIHPKEPKGCEVQYTKFNRTDNVASSTKGESYCNEVFERIQGKLETAGFACE